MSQVLTCPNGHEWSVDAGGTIGDSIACPVCGEAFVETLHLPAQPPIGIEETGTDRRDATNAEEAAPSTTPAKTQRPDAEYFLAEETRVANAAPATQDEGDAPSTFDHHAETLVPAEHPDQVDALLAGDARESSIEVLATRQITAPPGAAHPGRPSIPGYEILSELGRGGMGVVYKARQVRANRIVALKMILGGAHTSVAHRQRFRVEAEAAAKLQHPGIVQLFDVGDHDGQPYFSLEFVDGGSLTDHLDGTPWPAREAAQLVDVLARAMHYAHDQGIIHRDLKPANVLVSESEAGSFEQKRSSQSASSRASTLSERAAIRPKITDFGLAKLMESDVGHTQSGDVLGTPSYMAPEQAEGKLSLIGRATDVYALGAILYELITGRAPFKGTTLVDTLEQVRHHDPVSPRRLNFQAPRDVEIICLKCLQKEPAKRYATALELAEDLQRFRQGEPIKARPIGALERSWRWCKRNPRVASLAAGLLLVVAAAFVIITALMVQARAAEKRAVDNFNLAKDSIDRYFTEVSESTLLNEPGLKPLRRRLLLAARDHYLNLVAKYKDDEDLQADLGKALYRLAQISAETESNQEGIKYHEQAKDVFRKLVSKGAANADQRLNLGLTLHHLGRLSRLTNQTKESKQYYSEALTLWQQLLKEEPNNTEYRAEMARTEMGLGNLYDKLGNNTEAEKHYAKALEVRLTLVQLKNDRNRLEHRRDLATNQDNLAPIYYKLGKKKEGKALSESAQQSFRSLVRQHPVVSQYREDLVRALFNAGHLYSSEHEDRLEEAKKHYRNAILQCEELTKQHPTVAAFQIKLANCRDNLSVLLRNEGKLKEAEELLEGALKIREPLIARHPEHVPELARTYRTLSDLKRDQGKAMEAIAGYVKAFKLLEPFVKRRPRLPDPVYELATICGRLGLKDLADKKHASAKAWFQKELSTYEQLLRLDWDKQSAKLGIAIARSNLGDVERESNNADRALLRYEEAIEGLKKLNDAKHRLQEVRQALRNASWGRARALEQRKQFVRALESWNDAVNHSNGEQRLQLIHDRAVCRTHLANEHHGARKLVEAEAAWELAAAELEPLQRTKWNPTLLKSTLSATYQGHANTLTQTKKYDAAVAAWDKALSTCKKQDESWIKLYRRTALAGTGDRRAATVQLERLVTPKQPNGQVLYHVAATFATASGVASRDKELANQFAALAIKALTYAHKTEWAKRVDLVRRIKADVSFDALKGRREFEELMKKLQSNQ